MVHSLPNFRVGVWISRAVDPQRVWPPVGVAIRSLAARVRNNFWILLHNGLDDRRAQVQTRVDLIINHALRGRSSVTRWEWHDDNALDLAQLLEACLGTPPLWPQVHQILLRRPVHDLVLPGCYWPTLGWIIE